MVSALTPAYPLKSNLLGWSYRLKLRKGVTSHPSVQISVRAYNQALTQGSIRSVSFKGIRLGDGNFADLSCVFQRRKTMSTYFFLSNAECAEFAAPYQIPPEFIDGAAIEIQDNRNHKDYSIRLSEEGVVVPEWRKGFLECLRGRREEIPEPSEFFWKTLQNGNLALPGLPHVICLSYAGKTKKVKLDFDMVDGKPHVFIHYKDITETYLLNLDGSVEHVEQ